MTAPDADLADVLKEFVGQPVVLDTATTVVYLGILRSVGPQGFWLENADIHDCRDGHAHKEVYVHEAKADGIRTNRKSVFVMRVAVMSVSALRDIVPEDLE